MDQKIISLLNEWVKILPLKRESVKFQKYEEAARLRDSERVLIQNFFNSLDNETKIAMQGIDFDGKSIWGVESWLKSHLKEKYQLDVDSLESYSAYREFKFKLVLDENKTDSLDI